MRLIGLAVVLALTIVPFVAEAQEDQLSECLRTHFLKVIKALEERIKTETPEQRLDRMRRELKSLRPLYCETFRCGRWMATACD